MDIRNTKGPQLAFYRTVEFVEQNVMRWIKRH